VKRKKRGVPKDPEHGSQHHINPRSRRGPDDQWNIYQWIIIKHQAWHQLFDNRLPSEAIERIKGWILSNGELNKEAMGESKYQAWQEVFSSWNRKTETRHIWTPQQAIRYIEEKFLPTEIQFLKFSETQKEKSL